MLVTHITKIDKTMATRPTMRALTLDKLFHRMLVRRRQRLKLQLLCQIFCLQRRLRRLTRRLYQNQTKLQLQNSTAIVGRREEYR
eukprot:COSAG05_NODE_1273_length_5311_cov_11.089793_4_plen_85_part_00